jgi:hypothetical protein
MKKITRHSAIAILKAACDATARRDYAHKFTDNEEDLRACIHRHAREKLDADPHWRVFLSFSTPDVGTDHKQLKPDLAFLRSEPLHKNVSLEILVELKNWPKLDQIRSDLQKLIRLRRHFPDDQPDLVFFGILRFRGRSRQELEKTIMKGIHKPNWIHVWLHDHDSLYNGPWDSVKRTDPYREKLRSINKRAAAN